MTLKTLLKKKKKGSIISKSATNPKSVRIISMNKMYQTLFVTQRSFSATVQNPEGTRTSGLASKNTSSP